MFVVDLEDDEDEPPESFFYNVVHDAVIGHVSRPFDAFVYSDRGALYGLISISNRLVGALALTTADEYGDQTVHIIGPAALAAHGAIHVSSEDCELWDLFVVRNIESDDDEQEAGLLN